MDQLSDAPTEIDRGEAQERTAESELGVGCYVKDIMKEVVVSITGITLG